MAKKYRTKKEKEQRLKKGILIAAIVFGAAVVLTAAAGIIASAVLDSPAYIASKSVRSQMKKAYKNDPWDGAEKNSRFPGNEGDVWVYYEALMCIEDDAVATGGEGIVFSSAAGNTLCVDLSVIEDEELRRAVANMYEDYAEIKGMKFRIGSMEDLKDEGFIDDSEGGMNQYTRGCLLQIFENSWDEEHKYFTCNIFFYYNRSYGQGADIVVSKAENREEFEEWFNGSGRETVRQDGDWISVITSTIVA